jgi:Coenzyme PQQ synthesis protein D (PqqD)
VHTIAAGSRLRANQQVLARRLDEESVLLNPADGQYYALDLVGGRVWELCDGSHTLPEIAQIIGQEFEADPAVVSADLEELLGDMAEAGLVEASS